jgi:hypothetical protein
VDHNCLWNYSTLHSSVKAVVVEILIEMCSNKAIFTKISGGKDLVHGFQFANPWLRCSSPLLNRLSCSERSLGVTFHSVTSKTCFQVVHTFNLANLHWGCVPVSVHMCRPIKCTNFILTSLGLAHISRKSTHSKQP